MTFVFSSFLALITDAIAKGMDMIGNASINLLVMDIGSGVSFFDLVFSSIGDFYKVFCVMASALLALNYMWQIVKIMVMGLNASDTPLGLTARTFTAGCSIYLSKQIIYIVEGIFNIFYQYFLGANYTLSFSGFVTLLQNAGMYVNNAAFDPVGEVIDNQLTIPVLFFVLVIIIFITYQFLMYLLEVVERYVVLGVLVYTSPLAFSMAGSKSTSNIFASFVRMVGSQMILMVFNVFFLKLFLMSFSNYGTAITGLMSNPKYAGYSPLSLTIVWCLIMYGILYVGTRVDSYLGSLGLSVAQTGRGLGASMMAAGMSVMRLYDGARGAANKVAGRGAGSGSAKERTHIPPEKNAASGGYTADTAWNTVTGKSTAKDLKGFAAGSAVVDGTAGIPTAVSNKIDMNSAKISSGHMSADTIPNMNGEKGHFEQIPLDGARAQGFKPELFQGRETEFNGNKCFATFSGADAKQNLMANPAMDKKMAEFNAAQHCSASTLQQVNPDGVGASDTGIWQAIKTDKSGNVVAATQYAPASVYRADAAGNSHIETIGDMQYHVTDVTGDYSGNGFIKAPSVMDNAPIPGMSESDSVNNLASQFSAFNGSDGAPSISNVFTDGNSGIVNYTDKTTGKQYAMAPAAQYDVSSTDGTTPTANSIYMAQNGARYVAMEVPSGVESQTLFSKRNVSTTNDPIYCTEKMQVGDLSHYAPHDAFWKQSNDIGAEAKRRSTGSGKSNH